MSTGRLRTFLVCAIVALAGSGAVTASAQAGVLVSSASDCSAQALDQHFLPFADVAFYTEAPAGTFESNAGSWGRDDAGPVDDQEPWNVAGEGHKAMRIGNGGSTTSPTMCVGIGHPTVRFFARRVGGGMLGSLSTLRVDVMYESVLGLIEVLPIGVVTGLSDDWKVTAPMVMVANLLPLLPGEMTPVRFRFVPQGSADWKIDDVFVDPWSGR